MKPGRSPIAALIAVLALLAAPAAFAYEGGAVEGGVTVGGTVTFSGEAPGKEAHAIPADEEFCGGKEVLQEEIRVGAAGGLANVVVYLDKIEAGKVATPVTVRLDNAECRYEPHVVAAVVGSQVEVVNSDPVLHNTHARGPVGNSFNVALPNQGQVIPQKMRQPGLMKVGCDVHAWMSAYIAVFSHPYFAVTDADGKFAMDEVPPGAYTLVYWHEELGRQTAEVTVTAEGATADLVYED
jgi:plastocyanin